MYNFSTESLFCERELKGCVRYRSRFLTDSFYLSRISVWGKAVKD